MFGSVKHNIGAWDGRRLCLRSQSNTLRFSHFVSIAFRWFDLSDAHRANVWQMAAVNRAQISRVMNVRLSLSAFRREMFSAVWFAQSTFRIRKQAQIALPLTSMSAIKFTLLDINSIGVPESVCDWHWLNLNLISPQRIISVHVSMAGSLSAMWR